MRPGEKISEQLWEDETALHPTNHPDILSLIGENHTLEGPALRRRVDELAQLAERGDGKQLTRELNELVGGTIGQAPPPDLTSV
jgi:FlaA1/EpsC-like NDP-sugar epimerase